MGAGQAGVTLHPRQALPSTATDTFLLCSSPGTLGAITLQLKVLEVSKVRLLRMSWFPSFSFLPCLEGMSPAMSPLCPHPSGVHTSHAQPASTGPPCSAGQEVTILGWTMQVHERGNPSTGLSREMERDPDSA